MSHHIRPLNADDGAGDGGGEHAVGQGGLEGQEGQEALSTDGDEQAPGMDQQGHVAEELAPEDPAVRPLRDPGQPTEAECRQHELTHLPFRPWCADCVAGAAADHPHRRRAPRADDEGLTKVSVDYGFMSTTGEADPNRTLLIVHASRSKTVFAVVVTGKGRQDPKAVGWLVEQIRRLGVGQCVLQADGEIAQRTFVKDVIEEACRVSAVGIAPAHSPAYDHQANGAAEKAVRDVKDHVRVMLGALTRRVGVITIQEPIFEWLVQYAAELLSGARVGHDGMTPYRRLRGEAWKPELAEFCEKVMARRPRARDQPDADPRWDPCIYLGTKWGTAEHFVGDADGVVRKVRSIRRVSVQDRWDRELILRVTGVPGDAGRRFEDRQLPPAAAPPGEVIVIPHPPEVPLGPQRRGFKILKADLVKYGYTQHCPKCDATRGGRIVGTNHSPECRGRFRALFEDGNDGRVERAQARQVGGAEGPHAAAEAADEPIGAAPGTPLAPPIVPPQLPPIVPPQAQPAALPQASVDDDWNQLASRVRRRGQAAEAAAPAAGPDDDVLSNGTADTEIFDEEPEAPSAMLAACGPAQLPQSIVPRARWADIADESDEEQRSFLNTSSRSFLNTSSRSFLNTSSRSLGVKVQDIETKEDLVNVLTQTVQLPAAERARRLCLIGGVSEEATKEVVAELFSPPRVNAALRSMDNGWLRAGSSFDLVVDAESGQSWNFLKVEDRRRCWRQLKLEDPWVVIGSPPCTPFSVIQALNKTRSNPQEQQRKLIEGKVLLNFALDVYRWQVRRGRYFVHEHPATATSWTLPEVQKLLSHPTVECITSDMCMFGMRAVDAQGREGPVLKPTRWMTNAPRLARHLSRRCKGIHESHVRLLGGNRAARAARYPPELVEEIIRGLQLQREDDHREGRATCPLSSAIAQAMSIEDELRPLMAKEAWDEYSGDKLDATLVHKAKQEELTYFKKLGVWRVVPRKHARGQRVVGTRWVNSNKGDREHPEIRCRLVAQEVKTYETDEYYAATPPTEALKLVVSMAADDSRRQVTLVDISRAYFNAKIGRKVYVELPLEAGYGKDFVGELNKCMYGTRDAAQGWEATYSEALKEIGFKRGRAHPCVFRHNGRDVNLTVHGDDFLAEGRPEALDWFEKALLAKFEGKIKGRLKRDGDEIRLLNRIVRRTTEGYEWEADQRHAELIISGMGLLPQSKPLAAPGRKLTKKEQEDDNEDELSDADSSKYRGLAARANFLAQDRPDIAYSVKELCRGMSKPTARDMDALKRLARYLAGKPRVVLYLGWQRTPSIMSVYSDSDWAGCIRTRRSTTGGALMRGGHVLKTWATTQPTIALSSAEAELIAAVRGAAEGLSARTLCADFGRECKLRVHLDSSAAIGVSRRRGVGKIRHLDTRLLWIQERVHAGDLEVFKVAGVEIPADLMTKHLSEEALGNCLARLGCWPRTGRAASAPNV